MKLSNLTSTARSLIQTSAAAFGIRTEKLGEQWLYPSHPCDQDAANAFTATHPAEVYLLR